MTKRQSIQHQRLETLESEFHSLLPRLLKECAAGRWGLFGQNDQHEGRKYLPWPEAERLKDIAREIKSIREDSGEQNDKVEKFLSYCSLRGANVPGEPRQAQSLLAELGSNRDRSQ